MTQASDGNGAAQGLDLAVATAIKQVLARISEVRDESKMSQREAARRAGMDQRLWSRIEAGESPLRLEAMLRMQHALGLASLEQLLGPLPSEEALAGGARARRAAAAQNCGAEAEPGADIEG